MSTPGTDRFADSPIMDLAAHPAQAPQAATSGVVVDVTTQTFNDLVAQSNEVPVVLDLWAPWCEPCKQLSPVLEKLAAEYGGSFILAKVDVEANPEIQQAFGIQSIPTVVALLKAQPLPLFQGAVPEAQIRQVLDEVLKVAEQQGVTGRVQVGSGEDRQSAEPPLPPLHQEALAALEKGDLDAAVGAYETALKQNPGDDEARAALANVRLMQRLGDAPAADVIARADGDPMDIEAGLAAADAEVASGHPDAAFGRLLALIRHYRDEERETVRVRLVDLFGIVGNDQPEVIKARRELFSALY